MRLWSIWSWVVLVLLSCTWDSKQHDTATGPTIYLLSNGLVNDVLQKELVQLCKDFHEPMKVAVIVNATSSPTKRLEKLSKVKSRFYTAGLDTTHIESFDLLDQRPDLLLNYDIVYTLGGNPFLLFKEAQSTNVYNVLKNFPSDRILMGYSAGSLWLGPGLELMQSVDSLLGFNDIGLEDFEGLGFYDFHMFPHYNDFTKEVAGLADEIAAFEDRQHQEILRLNDEEGLIIIGGQSRHVK